MAKKEKMLEESKKNTPFNVLSKKGLATIAMAGIMIATPFMLAGCSNGTDGKDGLNGKDGAQWYSGTNAPVVSQGVDGDYYYDTDDYKLYQKENGSWVLKVEDFGKSGTNGTNIYVGYDGYVWQDGVRTTFKLDQDTTGRENVVEDTIGAYTTMGYWQGEYVDLSTNSIALMANYKPNAKLTQYSGTKVTEIQVVAESAGTLHIGTAKVADVVTARTNGTTYTATTTSHDVTAGVNTITLDLTVADDETIVIGGSGSTAKVYVVKNLPVSDEQGNFALVNGQANTDVVSKTGDYADTLAVRVRAEVEKVKVAFFNNLQSSYTSDKIANLNNVGTVSSPYALKDYSFAGKTIASICIPVKENKANSGEKPFITVYKIKASQTSNFKSGEAIRIYFDENTQANTFAEGIPNEPIELASDETLAFACADDTIIWGNDASITTYGFYTNAGATITTASLLVDVYVYESQTWQEHLSYLGECELRGYL